MAHRFRELTTDVLVVGSGGAALRTVLEANDAGADVLVVVKNEFRRSGATFHSVAEVGAFNIPDGAGDAEDNPDVYVNDILTAAQGMADPQLVRILAEEAESTLKYLEGYGVHFEQEDGRYLTFRACFSSKSRSHVIKDHFKPIIKALGMEATRRQIPVVDNLMIVNLIQRDGECLGAYALDVDGNPVVIRAKATILTTGGASQLFATNLYPPDITGDGYAMAYRAGAQLTNMEFMQAGVSIHAPFINLFGNYLWDARPSLTDKDGELFIKDYLPDGLTLEQVLEDKERHFPFSSSDNSKYVEISIQKAINSGRGSPEGGVYMDFIDTDFDRILSDKSRSIARMWPLTYEWYEKRGVDLNKDKVQITCSAHAINGGLRIDGDAQSTNLKGLYAAGETAAGPHGADRLGGNMALTCQVFGARAGRAAAARAREVQHRTVLDIYDEQAEYLARFSSRGSTKLDNLRQDLQALSNKHLLVIRDDEGLSSYLAGLDELQMRLLAATGIETAEQRKLAIETDNLIEVGRMMARAGLHRKESRGSHYREDFPQPDIAFDKNIIHDISHEQSLFEAAL
ncbi:MAG: FAD-binding protein [Pseudomonadota bacterium]